MRRNNRICSSSSSVIITERNIRISRNLFSFFPTLRVDWKLKVIFSSLPGFSLFLCNFTLFYNFYFMKRQINIQIAFLCDSLTFCVTNVMLSRNTFYMYLQFYIYKKTQFRKIVF